MNNIFLGIGTNLGDRRFNLREAVAMIREKIGPVFRSSSVYETEPWGFQAEDQFLNMVVEAGTDLTPAGLMNAISEIEKVLGRVRNTKQYSSRIIDVDILLFGDLIIDVKNLQIPHPMMHERRFVLVPLCEIAPERMHPVLKLPVASLLASCIDKGRVTIYRTIRQSDNQTI